MLSRRYLIALSAAAALKPSVLREARAGAWPDRAVHLVVPIAAGGPTDTNARLVAEQLSKIWGQQVVIDNKSGAGTNIGNAFVAHSDPDGYTLLYGTSSMSANGALYRALDYNPEADFAPISLVAKFPFFMFVPNSSPAKTVKDFIDDAKAHPGRLIGAGPLHGVNDSLRSLKARGPHVAPSASPAWTDLAVPARDS